MKNFIHHDIPKIQRSTADNGTRVYNTPSGRAYPSVTTVTGLLSAQSIMEWRQAVGNEEANKISSRASRRGTRIHSFCEDYLLGKPVKPDMFDQDMFNSIIPLISEINNIHALETPLYSDHLEVAGTVDCIAEFRGKLCVIDFKTSGRVKHRDDIHGYFMQTAAYAVAFEERTGIPVGHLAVMLAVDNDKPLLFMEKRDTWIGEFCKVRAQYKKQYKI